MTDLLCDRKRKCSCPCKGCERRTEGCHGQCKRYTAWKEKQEKQKAEERKIKRGMWEAYNRRSIAVQQYRKKNRRYQK